MLRVTCKVNEPFLMLTLQETLSVHYSMNRPKTNLLLIFTFYYKILNIKKYLEFRKQNSFVFNMESYKRFCRNVKRKTEQPA